MAGKPPTTLNDIAYDVNKKHGYTVYIPENNEYVPYLVLTNNYNDDGNCLLLRKYLLDVFMPYNNWMEHRNDPNYYIPSYYENSDIDKYLSGEFLKTLSSIRDSIIDSEIVITDIESIGCTGEKSLTIKRKVFLLSYTELTGPNVSVIVPEGIPIECFRLPSIGVKIFDFYDNSKEALEFRISTTTSGQAEFWWSRTPDTWDYNMVVGVTFEGGIGTMSVGGTEVVAFGEYKRGVRPAFCLPRDTAIQESDLDGEMVYIVTLE